MILLLLLLAASPAALPPINTLTRTTGALQLYVDPLGSDSKECTSTGTSACLTVQGAVNRCPKGLRHGCKVSVASGTFSSFIVSGFIPDFGYQTATSGVVVEGTLSNSTLATGSATGTATAVAANSTSTFSTLTDSGANWTTNDLQGRFLVITGGTGTGQSRVIASNTATAITIAGTWTSTLPVAGSVYAIQDSVSDIATCGIPPPVPGQVPVSTASYAIRVQGNAAGMAVILRNLKVSAACNFAIYQADAALMIVTRTQITETAGTASHIAYGGPTQIDNIVSKYSSTSGSHITGGGIVSFSFSPSQPGAITNPSAAAPCGGSIQNSLFVNGLQAISLRNCTGSQNLIGLQINNVNTTGISVSGTAINNFQGIQISCTSNTSAIAFGVFSSSTGAYLTPDHVVVSGCNTTISASGPGTYIDTTNAVTSTGGVTGIKATNGALVTLNGNGNTFTVSGDQILLDGSVTETITNISATSCKAGVAGWGTRVCKI